jgi:hypothetical protein
MDARKLYNMMKGNRKKHAKRRAVAQHLARRVIVKPIRSAIRREGKEVERLLWGLRLAVGADLDRMLKELRSRSIRADSALAAKLGEIDASLNLIAIELARRADDPPGERGG